MSTPLRRARERRGLTIVQVSAATGIDPGNLSRIERGTQVPSKDFAIRLAAQFDGLTEMEIIFPERFPAPGSADSANHAEHGALTALTAETAETAETAVAPPTAQPAAAEVGGAHA